MKARYDTVLCEKLLALLSEYFEGVSRPACRDLEKHIDECAPCAAFVATLKEAIAQPERGRSKEPPARVVAHLRKTIQLRPARAKTSLRAPRTTRTRAKL